MSIPRNLSFLAQGASSTGVLAATNGGTGLTSPGTNGNVLTSNGTAWASSAPTVSFSSSTAWASVSRTSGTTYTNSLSYPIMFLGTGGSNGTLTVVVNGVTVMSLTAAFSNYEFCCVIVPPGATYSYTTAVTAATGTFILS